MPRKKKNILTIEGWPDRTPGKLYPAKIVSAGLVGKQLLVRVEYLSTDQAGRIEEICLPSSARVGNQTSRFLTAAGQDAGTVGNQICTDDLKGAVIGVRFETYDGSDVSPSFERVKTVKGKEAEDEQMSAEPGQD